MEMKKHLARFLAMVMIMISIPMNVFADEIDKIISVNTNARQEKVINEDNVIQKTENKTVYELENGLKREVLYDTNVRFYDKNNKLTDYDPSLIKINSKKSDNNEDLSEYKYQNKAGDKKLYLPESVSTETPILLENEYNKIKIAPVIESKTSKVNVEKQKTINIYEDEVTLPIKANYEDRNSNNIYEYISQDNGIKENLVIKERPESNVFKYEVTVDNSLIAKKCETEESIIFNDKETGETKASIDVPFMNDKTGKAYSEDIIYNIEKSEENKYILTMTLSEDYLNDKDRVYPVTVDPTITWTGESNLIDTYILSNSKYADTNFYNSGTTAFPIGYTSSMGTCRSLIRSLDLLDTVKNKYVESATLTMYETSSCDKNMTVNAYRIIDSWTKKNVTWNNKPRYNTSSGIMGSVKTSGTLYKARVMDLTTYARGLANGTYPEDKGLMLKTENDTSSSAGYCKFYGSRHSSSALRPKFTVEYYDAPTVATSVKLSKAYLKKGETARLTWNGINSKALQTIEYRIARRDDNTGIIDSVSDSIVKYTKVGTTSNGSSDISTIKDLPEGCYRILVRGVDKSGIKGPATGYNFHIDNTKPTIGNVTFDSENVAITWKNANDLHFKEVQYSLNSRAYKTMSTDTSWSFIIPNDEFTQEGTYTIKVRSIDKSGNTSAVKSFKYENIIDSDIEGYKPLNLNISNYYGKNLITWDISKEDKTLGSISYNIYKGTTENFTPSNDNLIAENIKTFYYADMEIGKNSYYKIQAVVTGSTKKGEVSDSINGENISITEFDKRLGNKEYLGYFAFDTPNGNGTIEKSKGNLTYSQTDTELPTEQLDFSLQRIYNSQSTFSGMFGLGFSDTFHKELYKVGDNIVLSENDGSIYKFKKENENWVCDETKDYELNENSRENTYKIKISENEKKELQLTHKYEITTKDNTIYRFNEKGQLIVVTEPNETCIIYNYDNLGRLSKLTNSNGVEISLQYKEGNDKNLLEKIVLPDSSVLKYDYSNGKLTKFTHLKNDNLICFDKVNYCFEYDTNNLLTGIKDAKGNLYSINYNSDKASKVVYPNGENYNINYLNGLTEVSKINENRALIYTESTSFDTKNGKVTTETDANKNKTTYTYGNKNNQYLVTETSKIVDYQELNNNNEMIFKTKEVITTTDYNENEDVKEEIDEEGNITTYKYEFTDEINEHNPTKIVTTTSSNAKNTKYISNESFNYNPLGNLIEENDLINKTNTVSEFNENGQVVSENVTNTETNKTTSETIYNYDDLGNVTKESTATDNIESSQTNEYDSMGRVTLSTDSSTKNQTKTEYDYLGREVKTKLLNSSGTLIEEKENTYDENGTLIKEVLNGVTTNYEYDNLNRLTKKTISDSNGSVSYNTVYSYADVKHLNTGITTTDEKNLYCEKTYKNNLDIPIEIKYYDKNGNLVREKINGIYKDYVYDNNKNAIVTFEMNSNSDGEIDLSNKKISLSLYDKNGKNIVNVQNASISKGFFVTTKDSIVTKSEYDDLGNVTKETDAEGISTGYTYDKQSRVTAVISAEGTSLENQTIIDYSTDADSNTSITTITDANQNKSYEVKNAADLIISTEDEGDKNDTYDNIKTSYTYDKNGNKTIETFSNGDYKKYYYDSNNHNQLMQTVYFETEDNQSGKATLQTTYTYDFKGNITSMIDYKFDGNDSISYHYTYYEYDLNGKMTGYSEINASSKPSDGAINNHKLVYKYDVEGNITEIVYPTSLNDGITSIKFEYNEYNWITGIKAKINSVYKELRDYIYNSDGTINNIKDYTYDTNSNVNGYILKKYTYDNFGRVSSMKYYNSDSDTVKESYTYTYDKNSNIKSESIVNNYPTKDSDKVDEKRSYEYDKLNRLINSDIVNNKTNKTESYAYEYDKVGNMISKSNILSDTNNITDYTYNDLNQLVSSETSNLSTGKTTSKKTYSYDENGNNIKEVDSIKNITKEMTYDVDNRLDTYTQTENNKTTTQSNLYNGD
ncbi:DNRLRE domain-containing protein, partial [Intestinibacter bartlettii]